MFLDISVRNKLPSGVLWLTVLKCNGVGLCLDAIQTLGSLTVIDSSVARSGAFVYSSDTKNGSNQLVLDNIQSDGDGEATVVLDGNIVLSGSMPYTWVYGQIVSWHRFNSRRPHN